MRSKKPKVAVRLKVKRRRARKTVLLVVLASLSCLAYFNASKITNYFLNIKTPAWAQWRLKTVAVSGAPDGAEQKLVELVNLKPGAVLSGADCAALERRIASKFGYLRDITVRRRWIGKTLEIQVAARKPIAAVALPGRAEYLDDRGEFYGVELSTPQAGLLPLSLGNNYSGEKLDSEIVEFIKEINSAQEQFPCRPDSIALNKEGRSTIIKLQDGSNVEWGNFKYTAEKIYRLRQVFEKAKSQLPGPFCIDLRYFEDGKVFLKQLKINLLQ